jgi:hypothetical protein
LSVPFCVSDFLQRFLCQRTPDLDQTQTQRERQTHTHTHTYIHTREVWMSELTRLFFFPFFLWGANLHPTLSLLPNSYFGCVHFILFYFKIIRVDLFAWKFYFWNANFFILGSVQSFDFFFFF